jgi:hypothetical protein
MVAGIGAIYTVIFPALGLSMNEPTTAAIKSMPLWFRVILILRAGVRGNLLSRLCD